ncbi:MAG: hypothetical protein RQ875_11525 [Vicingaceae bacterium]|nr:hypothetical protein [Vicingaceae bacterium]
MKLISKILLVITIINTSILSAQETTTGEAIIHDPAAKNNVLLIPFESKMYFSDIDGDLSQKNEMNFHEIKAMFRAELDKNLFISLKEYFNPLSFYAMEQEVVQKELTYIYSSIGYKYQIIEPEVVEKETPAKKLFNKIKPKEKEKEPQEATIQNGEIVSEVDNREKFMNTVITNDNLIPNLNKTYESTYYVFINQLDIKKSADDAYKAAENQYKREIKVHYTIINSNTKEVSSGAIISRFNSSESDINKIIKIHFPLIAEKITQKLVAPTLQAE